MTKDRFKKTKPRKFKANKGGSSKPARNKDAASKPRKFKPKDTFTAGKKDGPKGILKKPSAFIPHLPKALPSTDAVSERKQAKEQTPKQIKRDLRRKRKMKKDPDTFKVSNHSKELWEEFRRNDLSKDRREVLAKQLHELLKGHCNKLVSAHDTSRVIQSMIKYGSEEQRNDIFQQMQPLIVDICRQRYAKFSLLKMMKYGTAEHKAFICKCLNGSIKKLLLHNDGGIVIENFYNNHATYAQRCTILGELYGMNFLVARKSPTDGFVDVCKAEPSLRDAMVNDLSANVIPLVQKACIRHSLVHKVVYDLLTVMTPTESQSLCEVARDGLIHMIHTKDGRKASTMMFSRSNNADKSEITKGLEKHIITIANSEHGYVFLMVVLLLCPDMEMVESVLDQLLEVMEESFYEASTFRKTICFPCLGPTTKLYSAELLQSLNDACRDAKVSDEDVEIRRASMKAYVYERFVDFLKTNTTKLASDSSTVVFIPLLVDALAETDHSSTFQVLAQAFGRRRVGPVKSTASVAAATLESIDDLPVSQLFRALLSNDKRRRAAGLPTQACALVDVLTADESVESLQTWLANNRGLFCLEQILKSEALDDGRRDAFVQCLMKRKTLLMKQEHPGAKHLISALKL